MKPGRPDATPPRRTYPTDFQRRTLWLAITAVSMLAVGAVAAYTIGVMTDVLQFLQPVLVPIAFAGILAYLLEPLVQRLTARGTPRFRAMMWVWVGFHGIMLLLLISVAVPTISSVKYFAREPGAITERVGNFLSMVVDGVDSFVGKFRGKDEDPAKDAEPASAAPPGAHTVQDGESIRSIATLYSVNPEDLEYANRGRKVEKGVILDLPDDAKPARPHGDPESAAGKSWVRARIRAWVAANGEEITAKVTGGLNRSLQGILGLIGYLVGFILVPLYLYYFLKESAAIQKGWSNYIPLRASKFKAELVDCLNEINGYLIAFFRGQMLVSMIDGLLIGISLAVIGLPYAFLIGVFVALLGLIPYVGNILCWFAAVAISIAHFGKTDATSGALEHSLWGIQEVWAYPLIVTAIFVVVQQLNSLVTAPRIVGDAVGLHPLTVIFSVLFWSLLIGGLLGALLAVPLTASLKVIFRRYIWERRVQPQLTAPGTTPFREAGENPQGYPRLSAGSIRSRCHGESALAWLDDSCRLSVRKPLRGSARGLANRPETVSDAGRMNLLRVLSFTLCLSAGAAGAVDFKKDIRPILKSKCYECHNAGMKQPKAGYVFDDLEKLSNDIGPKGQIVPGDPERSNILDLVTRDKDGMPPGNKEKLTAKEVKLLREWIQEGAVLDASKSGPQSSSSLVPRASESPPAPLQDWTNTEGKTIKARYVRMSGSDAVVVKTAEGKSYKVPLAKLSTDSQNQAKAAAAAEAKPSP